MLHSMGEGASVAVALALAVDLATSSCGVVGTAAALLVRCGSWVTNGAVSGVSLHVLFAR